jgi:hypothetical protein
MRQWFARILHKRVPLLGTSSVPTTDYAMHCLRILKLMNSPGLWWLPLASLPATTQQVIPILRVRQSETAPLPMPPHCKKYNSSVSDQIFPFAAASGRGI